jgi:hypothetical protein
MAAPAIGGLGVNHCLVNFLLDRQTAVDGAAFYNRCRQLCLAAIDTCLEELLEREG